MKDLFFALLILVSVAGCSIQQKSMKNKSPETIAKDAAWCWFSDPRAIYHTGKKEFVYFGYINMKGDVMVRSMDVKTKTINEFNLHSKLEVDDHNVPAFQILPDGKILAFYNHHNGNIFVRKTKNPEDITQWEEERILLEKGNGDVYCYVNPVMLEEENNRIYLFGRNITRKKGERYSNTRFYCIYSDDLGETWSEKVNFLDNSGRDTPPYIKYATNHKDRIDFLFTNGHPKLGNDISVFHMYYKNGKFFQTNGTLIGSFKDLPVVVKNVNHVYDATKTGVRGWIWDIALDEKSNPVITYARYPTFVDHKYYYARWDGQKWNDYKIADGGPYITILKPGKPLHEAHYSGGIVLDHQDTRNIYFSKKVGKKFEIEHSYIDSLGNQTSKQITSYSDADNLRPYVVYKKPGDPIIMWMKGNYYHYTDFDTELQLVSLKSQQ